MKKIICICLIISMSLSSCHNQITKNIETKIEEEREELQKKATEHFRDALLSQIDDFLKNKDLSSSLGLSETEQKKFEQSIEKRLDEYKLDGEQMEEALKAFEDFLGEASNFSFDDFNNEISKIIEQE